MKLKKIIFIVTLLCSLFFAQDIFSQGPPPWAPAHGYRAKTRHVYFPNQNMYYDLQKGVYIYINNGNWSISASLPTIFGTINLSKEVTVELDFTGDKPQVYNSSHVTKYKGKKVKNKAKAKNKKKK